MVCKSCHELYNTTTSNNNNINNQKILPVNKNSMGLMFVKVSPKISKRYGIIQCLCRKRDKPRFESHVVYERQQHLYLYCDFIRKAWNMFSGQFPKHSDPLFFQKWTILAYKYYFLLKCMNVFTFTLLWPLTTLVSH